MMVNDLLPHFAVAVRDTAEPVVLALEGVGVDCAQPNSVSFRVLSQSVVTISLVPAHSCKWTSENVVMAAQHHRAQEVATIGVSGRVT
jgi:hypothetical protein